MATTTEKTEKAERRRIPVPPTTRKQEERFAEAQEQEREQSEGDPVDLARAAISEARRALQDAEDALDEI